MSGRLKNYAYITKSGKFVCKVKGLTLNYRASTIASPEALEKMLKEEIDIINITYPKYIHRTRQHTVQTLSLTKQYRLCMINARRVSDYRTLLYGFWQFLHLMHFIVKCWILTYFYWCILWLNDLVYDFKKNFFRLLYQINWMIFLKSCHSLTCTPTIH